MRGKLLSFYQNLVRPYIVPKGLPFFLISSINADIFLIDQFLIDQL